MPQQDKLYSAINKSELKAEKKLGFGGKKKVANFFRWVFRTQKIWTETNIFIVCCKNAKRWFHYLRFWVNFCQTLQLQLKRRTAETLWFGSKTFKVGHKEKHWGDGIAQR